MDLVTIAPEVRTAAFKACAFALIGHGKEEMREILEALARGTDPSLRPDFYGEGKLIADFEAKIAQLLGFPAAVFMPSGTMAQPIALRIWSDKRKNKTVAFHPFAHLELHEQRAYSALHGLDSILVGESDRIIILRDLEKISRPIAALLLELPQREIGGALPTWEQLIAIRDWARERQIALHLDGARLWECQPFYQRSYAEIAGIFDSVYVSFYKGIGAIAGAILAGSAEFIAESKIWQRRQGGNLISLFPYLLSADQKFAERITKMSAYVQKAKVVAGFLQEFAEVAITPDPPQTNMFHIYVRGERDKLNHASYRIANEEKVYLFHRFSETPDPHIQKIEFYAGDGTLELSDGVIRELFNKFFAYARA